VSHAGPGRLQRRSRASFESGRKACHPALVSDVEFRVLGPFEAVEDGRSTPLAGRRQRALLVALLLHPNETVSADRLVECVWGEAAPSSARHVLHTYVSQLRAALGDGVSLRTRPPGYVLEFDGERLDASRFERRLRAARDVGDAETAHTLLAEALSEWRGPVAADLELEGDALVAARPLEALRVEAIEARADAALALGRHAELVPDLEQLVAAEPLRERPREQLMLALYRSGRQSEALAAYREARRHFSSQLGIEPGPELRRLERAILEHDPSLAAPVPASSAPPSVRRNRRAAGAVAAAGAVTAIAAVVILVLVGHARGVTLRAGGVGVLDGATGHVLASPLDRGAADALVVAGRDAWVGRTSPRSIVEIDARHRVVRSIILPEPAYALAAAGGSIWIALAYDGTIARLAQDHLAPPYRPTPTSRGRLALVADGDSLWIASQDGYLTRISTRSIASPPTSASAPPMHWPPASAASGSPQRLRTQLSTSTRAPGASSSASPSAASPPPWPPAQAASGRQPPPKAAYGESTRTTTMYWRRPGQSRNRTRSRQPAVTSGSRRERAERLLRSIRGANASSRMSTFRHQPLISPAPTMSCG
jgi:DNA-binding SARP family transcriptional activator